MSKTLKEHIEEFDGNFEDPVSAVRNPFSENLFSSVSQLNQDIKNRDEIIEGKEQEVEKLKSQIVIMEKRK